MFIIRKKYFDLYLMVGNISIDGFKRERYILKVKDFTDEISKAQNKLNDEEVSVESFKTLRKMASHRENMRQLNGNVKAKTQITFVDNLENITQLLLKIETLEESKKKLQ